MNYFSCSTVHQNCALINCFVCIADRIADLCLEMCFKKSSMEQDLQADEIPEVLSNEMEVDDESDEDFESEQEYTDEEDLLECLNHVLTKYERGGSITMEEWKEMDDEIKTLKFIMAYIVKQEVKKDDTNDGPVPCILENAFDQFVAGLLLDMVNL